MAYTYLIPQIPTNKDHIQVGATNLAIKLQIKEGNEILNLVSASVSASSITIIIEKPNSTLISASASYFNDGTDGIVFYRTSGSSDLDQVGNYNVQAYLIMPDFSGYTTPVTFTVYENLPLTDINNLLQD
jgi:hypothetical protein